MPLFDRKEYDITSFKGFQIYTTGTDMSAGKNLTVHSFINSGTKAEENGNKEKTFSITGYLIGADYLIQKKELEKALDSAGSGILIDKYYGELTVFVDDYSFSEANTIIGRCNVSIKFIKAEDNLIVINNKSFTRNLALNYNAFNEFEEGFNPFVGVEMFHEFVKKIQTMYNDLFAPLRYISDQIDSVTNDFIALKNITTVGETFSLPAIFQKSSNGSKFSSNQSGSDSTYASYVNSNSLDQSSAVAASDSLGSVIDSISVANLQIQSDDAMNPINMINDMLKVNDATNTLLDETGLSEKDIKVVVSGMATSLRSTLDRSGVEGSPTGEIIYSNAVSFASVLTIVQLQSIITRIDSSTFTTGDSFGIFKEQVLDVFAMLEGILTSQATLTELLTLKNDFINQYTLLYSSLQNLETLNQAGTTDIYSLTLERYNDISRVFEVIQNNDIVDPIFINGNIKVI